MRFKHTDFHVHTTPWSVDVAQDGPTFVDYIEVAEEYQCNLKSFDIDHGTVLFSFDNDELDAKILKILGED